MAAPDSFSNAITGRDHACAAVTAADVNGDGADDLIVGAEGARDRAGQTYVVFGGLGAFPAEFDLATLLPQRGGDGSAGFVLDGAAGDYAGTSVDAADVNGDGVSDVIAGAPGADAPEIGSGRTYVVFGRTGGTTPVFPARMNLARLLAANGGDGTLGVVFNG
jgi:hypothetical protein